MPRCELRALRRQDEDREEPVSQLALFGDVPAVAAPARTEPPVDRDGSRRSNGHAASLTLGEAARIIREAVKDKSYRSTPLGQLVGRYLRWFRNEYGATRSTLRDYEAVLARMSITLADKEAIEVCVDDLRDVIDLWGERSPRTRQKVTSVVRAFWTWAEEQGQIAISPAARIRRPRAEKRVAPLLPADARPRLLTVAKHPRDRLPLFCLLLLVRRGELAGIQVRDFDAQRCSLRVRGKGRKERALPLRGPVLAELRLFLSSDLPHIGRPPEPDDYLLYPTKKVYDGRGPEGQQKLAVRAYPKKRPSPQAVHRWWYRQLEAAGLVGQGITHGLNMHLARHTFATELRRVAGIDAASQALGHADLNTTLGIYGHRDQTDPEAAMEAYARWLEQQREDGIVPPQADL
jgi:integrase/recombinase XerC